jgi:DNA-binding response OmpR family regulator
MKILVVDDEIEIRRILRLLLQGHGYEVCEAADGAAAVDTVRNDRGIDLCIMDIMMPGISGVEATEQIRRLSGVPVLFLTARSMVSDKEEAYSAGGDDYLVKPFSSKELMMKVEALIRRYNSYGVKEDGSQDGVRLPDGVLVNVEGRAVFKNGVRLDLRDKELELLLYLVKNRGRIVSPEELYRAVWEEMPLASSANNVTVHILNLRRKLELSSAQPRIIRTVWGKGYQID